VTDRVAADAFLGRVVRVRQDLLDLLDRDTMLGDLLDVSFRIILEIPDHSGVDHPDSIPQPHADTGHLCCIIQQQTRDDNSLCTSRTGSQPVSSLAPFLFSDAAGRRHDGAPLNNPRWILDGLGLALNVKIL
jgi:hypothetical protein